MTCRLFAPLLTGSLFATAGCLLAASSAIALEVNFTTVQERSSETVEIEQNVVQNFRALQQAELENLSSAEAEPVAEDAAGEGELAETAASAEADGSEGFVEVSDD